MSEFRKDPVFNIWTIIDNNMPVSVNVDNDNMEQLKEFEPNCQFCPGNEQHTGKELLKYNFISKNKNDWDIRVFPKNNPVVKVETKLDKAAEGIYDWISGVGANEIVVESPKHNHKYYQMSLNRIEQIFFAYHDRIWDLKNDIRLEYILFFKDFLKKSEFEIKHPHSELLATPFVPPLVEEEIQNGQNYYNTKERCVFCDIVKSEIKSGVRLVARNENFIAICPYASRKPFEIWMLPVNHSSHFEKSKKTEYYGLAEIFSVCSKKLKKVAGCENFSFALHNSPLKSENLPYYHWHLEIYPDIVKTSVLHIGGCMHINPVSPEIAARALREEDF